MQFDGQSSGACLIAGIKACILGGRQEHDISITRDMFQYFDGFGRKYRYHVENCESYEDFRHEQFDGGLLEKSRKS